MDGFTVVQADSVSSGTVDCTSVASISGNTTVEVSLNGQDWSSSSMTTELVAMANVSSVIPGVVSAAGGAIVTVEGSGLLVGSAMTYCAIGGSSLDRSSWGYSE